MIARVAVAGLVTAIGLAGCGGEPPCDPVASVVRLAPSCEDAPAPTFEELHETVIAPSCAVGSTCHSVEHRISELDLSDAALARAALVEGGYARPGAPECSELAARVTSDDPLFRMPPAARLTVEQQCAIVAWLREGAP